MQTEPGHRRIEKGRQRESPGREKGEYNEGGEGWGGVESGKRKWARVDEE